MLATVSSMRGVDQATKREPSDTSVFQAYREARPLIAIFLAIADDQIVQVMIQGDPDRLLRLS